MSADTDLKLISKRVETGWSLLTYWFLSCVVERIRICVDSLSLDLVGPATIVSKATDAQADVDLGHAKGLAIVQSLNRGELIQVTLEEVGQFHETFASLFRSDEPPCLLERLARSGHGNVNVLFCGLMNGYDGFLGARIDGFEGLAIDAFDEFVVDKSTQQLSTSTPPRQNSMRSDIRGS